MDEGETVLPLDITRIHTTFKGLEYKKREEVLKRSFIYQEAFSMFDLYGTDNRHISTDTYLICLDGNGAVIMKNRPPQVDKMKDSLDNFYNNTNEFITPVDFDMYRSAEAIVEDMDVDKPIIILLTTDVIGKFFLENISVLVVVKNTSGPIDVLIVDPLMTLPYKTTHDIGTLEHPSNVHRRITSPDFRLKLSIVNAIFYNVDANIQIAPMKYYGTLFHPDMSELSRPFFPVLVMGLIVKAIAMAEVVITDAILDALAKESDFLQLVNYVLMIDSDNHPLMIPK